MILATFRRACPTQGHPLRLMFADFRIEVKTGTAISARDFAGRKAFRDQAGRRLQAGMVLSPGDLPVPFGDRLRLAPVPALQAP